jgi:hypothetical protein
MVISVYRQIVLLKKAAMACVSWFLLVHISFAQAPPPVQEKVTVVDDHLVEDPASGVRVGKLRVQLGSTKISDVGVELRNVITNHERTSYGGFSWLCFTVSDVRSPSRVWVESDDEMGGAEQLVTGVYTKLLARDAKPTSQCPALPDGNVSVTFDNDLKLGSSAEDLKRAFGPAPPAKNGWLRYMNDNSSGIHANLGEFDVELRNGVVVSIQVTHLETT